VLDVNESRNVIYLRVPRPAQLGAESDRLAWQLIDACQRIRESDERPVAMALIGVGQAFCARPPESAADCDAGASAWREATAAVAGLAPPTVAALGGDAIGPALALALACDLRIAEQPVRLSAPEVRFGRIPSAGGTQRLARAVGRSVALRMLLLGETLTATEAMNLGLVHRVASAGELEAGFEELLDSLRAGAPIALAYTKEAIRAGSELPLNAGLTLEADLAALLQTTSDRSEGIQAFKERRAPRFEGR
jgi:enoyl-CoA hydratase/carnithine racemase